MPKTERETLLADVRAAEYELFAAEDAMNQAEDKYDEAIDDYQDAVQVLKETRVSLTEYDERNPE